MKFLIRAMMVLQMVRNHRPLLHFLEDIQEQGQNPVGQQVQHPLFGE